MLSLKSFPKRHGCKLSADQMAFPALEAATYDVTHITRKIFLNGILIWKANECQNTQTVLINVT